MTNRSYAIIGTGALGAYYGAKLHHAGLNVQFLLHSDYQHVIEHGLKVESKDGDLSIQSPNAHQQTSDMKPVDVVLIGLKSTNNHILADILPPILKTDTTVILMQNGLSEEDKIAPILDNPNQNILGGLAFLCSNKIGPGHIKHLDYGQVRLGHYTPNNQPIGITPAMKAIQSDFQRANIPIELEEDLHLARWKKLVWNVPFNGLSVTLNTTTDQLINFPPTRELCQALMDEVLAGAKACGRIIPPDFATYMMNLTEKMTPYRTSMKIDFDEKRPLEVQSIFTNPVLAAEAAGTQLPLIKSLSSQLHFLDIQNQHPPTDPRP